jgi:FSR family fosmidomycin resistance protein-like MFS transporter
LKLRPLICLALVHMLVDGFGQFVSPLWPALKDRLGLAPWLFAVVYTTWQMATSVSQPLFGYWGDRFGARWMVVFGPALAIVCTSLIGFASGPVGILVLLALGGLGIGAFHPEAAVGVVEAAGPKATRGLSLFTFGGMVGLGLGPVVSGTLSDHFGLTSLVWAAGPGLVILTLLFLGHRPATHHVTLVEERFSLGEILEGRWREVVLLLAVATLRVIPVLGISLLLAFLLHRQGMADATIGWTQSLFLLSGSLGTLVCPWFTRPGKEIPALLWTTLTATACLVLLAWQHPVAYYVGLVGAGWFFQGAIPILIAYSQRLLPRGRRMAASLTLGTSWGLGGFLVAGLQAYFSAIDYLEGMIWALVPFALGSAVVTCLLPRLTSEAPLAVTAPVLEPLEGSVSA